MRVRAYGELTSHYFDDAIKRHRLPLMPADSITDAARTK